MLHLRARYFPRDEGEGLPRVPSLTFTISLISWRRQKSSKRKKVRSANLIFLIQESTKILKCEEI